MKAVGLVTFWDNNYGSALQCYATKKIVSSFGYRCDLIEEKHSNKSTHYMHMLKKSIRIPIKSLIYPNFLKSYLELRRHARLASTSLSDKSKNDIHFFGITELQPIELTRKSLKRIGKSDEYVAFITGSDQVWGGHFVEPTYGNFLEFAPKYKRISYAASFGSNNISNYNYFKYKKGIKGINKISVRENSGIEIVRKLTGRDVLKMPDPTILLTIDEWKSFSKEVLVEKEPYVLVHFLDNMSNNAIEVIKMFLKDKKMRVLCVGWKRDEILSLENVFFVDGGPKEYISLINNASYVCTDSFHTTLFALRFKKQFYTFPRSYAHSFHQSSRINNLLIDTCCYDRYIKNEIKSLDDLPQKNVDCSNFFDKQRNIGMDYLLKAIPNIKSYEKIYPNLKEENECCGCGVCAEKCPTQAIKMICGDKGYSLPQIDNKLCVSCGLCEKICRQKISREKVKKQAYIAYSNDSVLLENSASGGVFSSVAKQFILHCGVVYGAMMIRSNEKMYVEHRCATTIDELFPLLQSKYVQSNAVVCFRDIEKRLLKNQLVLFGGTSCQVDALYRYLGRQYDNLYTMDLICHGVPGEKFFSDYVKYIEEKNKSMVISFLFREKRYGKIEYIQSIIFKNGKNLQTSADKSDYYRLFFSEDSYREGCYNCEFASINKPADITMGDYFECYKDYPELFKGEDSLEKINGLSCCIVNSERGKEIFKKFGNDLTLIPADLRKIQNCHNNLCFPSKPTDLREKVMKFYISGGFKKIHKYYKCLDYALFLPKLAKKIMKNLLK